jgi:WD40 repeat protein
MYNGENGKLMTSFFGHEKAISISKFALDGKTVITASEDASIRTWNPKSGENIKKMQGKCCVIFLILRIINLF